MTNDMEIRSYETRAESETSDNRTVIRGYAAVFNERSYPFLNRKELPFPFVERIQPGAFRDTLATGSNVFALVSHDKMKPLASTESGTLTLREDGDKGLYYVCELPDTSYARDLAELARRGIVTTCSFGMVVERDRVDENGKGLPVRTLERVRLAEISLGVVSPAYGQTSMSIRSLEDWADQKDRAAKRARMQKIIECLRI